MVFGVYTCMFVCVFCTHMYVCACMSKVSVRARDHSNISACVCNLGWGYSIGN